MLRFLESLQFVLFVFFTAAYAYQIVYLAVGLLGKGRQGKQDAKLHRYAAIIAARNEAGVIGDLIKTLKQQDYPTELLGHQYAILELEPDEVSELLEYPQIEYFEPSEGLSPFLQAGLDSACITPIKRDEALGLTGTGVMIGFIDSGIDLTHPEFLTENGATRVLWLWDMTIPGSPPLGFRKGTVYSAREIDEGNTDSRDVVGHGTAAAAIAAGRSGIAPGAAIVAVKMGSGNSAIVYLSVDLIAQLHEQCRQLKPEA